MAEMTSEPNEGFNVSFKVSPQHMGRKITQSFSKIHQYLGKILVTLCVPQNPRSLEEFMLV